MLTIKAEVQKGKLRSDGTYNVKVRFTKDRVVKRISTDLFATDVDLTSKLKFKEDSPIRVTAMSHWNAAIFLLAYNVNYSL